MGYDFKTTPFDHQLRIFNETRELAYHGLLWEQGTGKTKPIIDIATDLYERGEIDAMVVVAPNGVHRNWITDEIPVHMPDRVRSKSRMMYYSAPKASTKWHKRECDQLVKHNGLAILCMSYSAFITEKGKNYIWRFLRRRRCLYSLDESHHIKTPGAKRTKSIVASGVYAPYRRILTGTPGDKPFDLYSQLKFLDRDIWKRRGMDTFHAFKQHFGVWFTAEECRRLHGYDPGYDQLIEYKNIDELNAILATVSDRVLKTDVLDLPPQLYKKRYFDMSPEQTRIYRQLRDEYEVEMEDGAIIDGNLAITRLLRLQQITCGYAVTDADEPLRMIGKRNPRLDAAIEYSEGVHHPMIFWARFTHDIDQLMDALGPRAVRYDGTLTDDEAEWSKNAFNGGDRDWLVGNPAKGSEGLTFNVAKTMGHYSSSFKMIERLQAEARMHRIGQEGAVHEEGGELSVLHVDFIAPGTVDDHIVRSLRGKFDIASQITGDMLREWL